MMDEYMRIGAWSGGCYIDGVGQRCREGGAGDPRAGDPGYTVPVRPVTFPGE